MRQGVDGPESCGFLFNDLLDASGGSETVVTWILTADATTHSDTGVFGIRPEMTEKGKPTARNVIVTDYENGWYHFPDIGVAAMPMAVLRDYAARKKWAWSTQEVTDGLAATPQDIAGLGRDPHTILVLGHPADRAGRPPGIAVGRTGPHDGGLALLGEIDPGFIGAPAFVPSPNPEQPGSDGLVIKCVGVVLPGGTAHPVATFDAIRPLLRRIAVEELAPGVYT